MYYLGCLVEECADPVRAVEFYTRAVEEGTDFDVMMSLAKLLQHGAEGLAIHASRSAELYTRVIEESGDPDAMCSFRLLLEHGAEGVPADPKRAAKLFSRAMDEAGSESTWYTVRHLLQSGVEGLPEDPDVVVRERRAGWPCSFCGKLLGEGADGVLAEPSRAQRLL